MHNVKRFFLLLAIANFFIPDFFPGYADDIIVLIATAIINNDLVLDR